MRWPDESTRFPTRKPGDPVVDRRRLPATPWSPRTAAILALGSLLAAGAALAEPVTVRYHDQGKYREEGLLRFVVEVQDEGAPIEGLDHATWGLTRGEKTVEAQADPVLFRANGMATSVLVVLAANSNFLPAEDEVGPDGNRVKKPMAYALDALDSLRNNLGSYLVTVACYDEVRRDPEFLKTNGVASKMSAFTLDEVIAACRPPAEEVRGGQPRLPTLLLAAAQKWLRQRKPETLRFVMVVITDGISEEPVQEHWLRSIRNQFGGDITGWLDLYVVGLEDGGDPANLKALARDGVLASTGKREDLPKKVAALTPLIAGNGLYDVRFAVAERVTGASVPLVVTAQSGEGQRLASAPYTLVRLERKTGWLRIVIIVLGVLVGLLIVVVIIRLIAAAVEARRRRREEEAARASAPYEGPSRGKLIVRDGPATGTTFHLIEDVTYIGRSPDNHVSIPDGSVGKRHASIHIRDRTYEIEDLQSRNGVFVNGQRVLKAHLKDGDSIRLGSTEMQFRL